jgi:outer membrane protein assembly factor BamB
MIAGVQIITVLQLLSVPAVGVQRQASVNEKSTRSKLDDQSGEKFDDKSGWKLNVKLDRSRVTVYEAAGWTALGHMNKLGVTKYRSHAIKRKTREGGRFFWPDSVNRESAQLYSGAKDLTESVSWGWHHPDGLYATIPVGSPLIDSDTNIYLGTDDAIRKFDSNGTILWSYAPRGQLAAAPTLSDGCPPTRMAAHVMDDISAEEEELLRPDWIKGNVSDTSPFGFRSVLKDFKVGDLIKVKAGASYRADGRELYTSGDQGLISGVVPAVDEEGKNDRAVIQWMRTGRKSAVQFDAIKNHFVRVEEMSSTCTPLLIGSLTSGFVFAIDLTGGHEQWVIQGSSQIAGVKGALASKDGIVVVATNRCTDRYCYRYRNQTNPLTPGNTVVRGLNVVDGSQAWEYVPRAPVWNMNPVWGPSDNVFFNDQEGRLYSLNLSTGDELWEPAGGEIGTYTEAAAVYDSSSHNNVYAFGMLPYTGSGCNPYTAPGILPACGNAPYRQGIIRAYNASSGNLRWERVTPHPIAGGVAGMLNSPRFQTRLVVVMGHNCGFASPTQIWSLSPDSGGVRFAKDGPTLWTSMCAGDKEGGDIRRATGGRAACHPGSWSAPIIDRDGDIYVGNQVGVYERWGSPTERNVDVQALSSLSTSVAFQDTATAIADGLMAVASCTSLIVFQADFQDQFENATWTFPPHGYTDASSAAYAR